MLNDYGNYGNDNYGNDYEGGEKEFIDIDMESAMQDKAKEEIEHVKMQDFYNIIFSHRLLQMVNLIASVSTGSAYASHILFNISHP